MPRRGRLHLMYHELARPGRPPSRTEAGYLRYVVTEADFRAQLAHLAAAGLRGMTVTEALADPGSRTPGVAITFDDGCETDLSDAAPLLEGFAFRATFYVVAGFVGQRGYLSAAGLCELAARGFEVGSHSLTHAFLSDLPPEALRAELYESKARLEGILGRPVDHFACPGGRFTRRVAEVAREAGYRSLSTSRIGVNGPAADPFELARVPIVRGTRLDVFERLVDGRGLLVSRARQALLGGAREVLGGGLYERFRERLLGGTVS